MEELVKYIVTHLVVEKDKVEVTSKQKENGETILEVVVAEQDKGKVIGKNGRIAQSLRAIIKSASSDSGKRFYVEIK